MGIHHVSLLVSSEKTLEFYKLLGFIESFRKVRKTDKVVLLDGYGIQLEIFIDERHPTRTRGVTEPLGPRHFALKVDDIENEKDRIKRQCLKKLSYNPQFQDTSLDWTGENYCFFCDPDGNVVELHN